MAGKYWRRVCFEACLATLRALGLDSPERAAFGIIAAIIGVAAVWFATKGGMTADLIFRVLGAAAIVAFFHGCLRLEIRINPAENGFGRAR
jgi:hypothetical protein